MNRQEFILFLMTVYDYMNSPLPLSFPPKVFNPSEVKMLSNIFLEIPWFRPDHIPNPKEFTSESHYLPYLHIQLYPQNDPYPQSLEIIYHNPQYRTPIKPENIYLPTVQSVYFL